jgi:hypothetical protein
VDARIAALEASLRRLRLLAYALVLTLLVVGTAAWRSRSDEVRAASLVLTDAGDDAVLILRGEADLHGPGLLLVRPSGAVVMRLGGSAVRPVR